MFSAAAFLEAYRRARLEPNKKYPLPLTESQEIGWFSNELVRNKSLFFPISLQNELFTILDRTTFLNPIL